MFARIVFLVIAAAVVGQVFGHLTVPNCGRRYAYQTYLDAINDKANAQAHVIANAIVASANQVNRLGREESDSGSETAEGPTPDFNIIGGRHARENEFPWMASLQIRNFIGGRMVHKCGATIL